ncbi:hypothetical protein PRUPE_4G141500 [Prunus persica]|uniref:BAHD acyltransferase n=1 Tax=Prunus persica TaxID=3760 RepID=A0A251PKH1_PRUPE|nr:BAHD acyltransferase At5g47980-like [Prunus persica]ONI12058.1 hypothetical protein PRUPE_4G141500 [Prunus persica]
MASEIKVEVTHKETIKPSSPTPSHLQITNLSVFDQLSPDVYIPLLLFYPNNSSDDDDEVNKIDHHSLVAEKSKLLKASLSETLTHFYPFAGKFQYNVSISCNDHGTAFSEAQVNCPILKILDKPDFGILRKLLPTDIASTQADTGYLLLVQANFFECGGLAIGVSSSHIISDAYTLRTFIKSWADIALMGTFTTDRHAVLPQKFGAAATLFPQLDFLNSAQPAVEFAEEKCITKRFVFDASNIAALKSRAASAALPNPTRVEAVSALIWKCVWEASRVSTSGIVRPSEWSLVVNIRKILVQQPLADDLMGNLVGVFTVKTEAREVVDIDVQSLVTKLRKGVEEFKAKYGNGVSGVEVCHFFKEFRNFMTRDADNYNCSSWCRFPFYETNFGWGNPLWVCQCIGVKNLFVLMDTRNGDGVEASLTFNEEVMAVFETNKNLLEYASVNPAVI